VKWPLVNRSVPLGSTLTLSNVALGPVRLSLRAGHGIAIAYPPVSSND
jgi:thiamine pyrophosphokinase